MYISTPLPRCTLQDVAKVYTYKLLKRYNIFGYNETGMVTDSAAAAKLTEYHSSAHTPHTPKGGIHSSTIGNGNSGFQRVQPLHPASAMDCGSFLSAAVSNFAGGASTAASNKHHNKGV